MSEKDVTRFLEILGLTNREINVYMFLAKSSVQSISFVAKRLKMERVQAYRTFKKLQEKGFIEATMERPTRFTIVPFETLFDNFIKQKKIEVSNLTEQKQKLVSAWKSVSAPESEYTFAKFSIFSGKRKIHLKMVNMIEEAKSEIKVLTTTRGLIKEDIAGIFDTVVSPSREHNVQIQLITDVSMDNLKVVESLNGSVAEEKLNFKLRHVHMGSKFLPIFLIKDEEEAILYSSFGNEASVLNMEDEGLWINDKMFISVLKAFFEQIWQSGVDVSRRIGELKSGIPIGENIVIKDAGEAWEKVTKVLDSAKHDIMVITSSQSINRLSDDPIIKFFKKDLIIRLMASIDLDNLEPAQALAKNYEVKHVPISYLTMMLVDKKHLFMFKIPPLSDLGSESAFYLSDTFYSTDPSQIERASEMLEDMWKRGKGIQEISEQAGAKLPTVEVTDGETVAKAASRMIHDGVTSVLITENHMPLGVINDRGILKGIIERQFDPFTTRIGDLNYMPLIVLTYNETILTAVRYMEKCGFKRAAMIKNGKLIGMLTENDTKKTALKVQTAKQ
jgi:sugar-specific transcriptional regulator TrmB/CBS domain-containing protein